MKEEKAVSAVTILFILSLHNKDYLTNSRNADQHHGPGQGSMWLKGTLHEEAQQEALIDRHTCAPVHPIHLITSQLRSAPVGGAQTHTRHGREDNTKYSRDTPPLKKRKPIGFRQQYLNT